MIRKISALLVIVALMAGLMGTSLAAMATPVTHTCSQNVAIVESYPGYRANSANGGVLKTSGFPSTTPGGAAFAPSFTFVSPDALANGATDPIASGYDTVVVNAVYGGEGGFFPNYRTTTFYNRLENFVHNGGKLIIYTSEQTNGDWTGFFRPFESNTPGAQQAYVGTLTVAEENTLSSAVPANPYYVDTAQIATATDAVGDANVFTTYDENWCVDMTATNVALVEGPMHCYSHYYTGLVIYNGLNIDHMGTGFGSDTGLVNIWTFELMQPWNPTGLPCHIHAAGNLTLTPVQASNPIATRHCLVATLVDDTGAPVQNIVVTFTVTGVNTVTPGTDSTDAYGNAHFCYTGTIEGLDKIVATCTDNTGAALTSNDCYKTWTGTGPTPVVVGGDINPVSKVALLTPWIASAIILVAGAAILVWRRRTQS
jgi:hypothetical protein